MHTTRLRKVGGSIMLSVPPPILEMLHLGAGATVAISVEGTRLIVEPNRVRYTLEELLAQCDASAPMSEEDQEWLAARPKGRELL